MAAFALMALVNWPQAEFSWMPLLAHWASAIARIAYQMCAAIHLQLEDPHEHQGEAKSVHRSAKADNSQIIQKVPSRQRAY